MECLIGIKGKDFTVIACDTMASRSVVAMKKGLNLLLSFLYVTEQPLSIVPTMLSKLESLDSSSDSVGR